MTMAISPGATGSAQSNGLNVTTRSRSVIGVCVGYAATPAETTVRHLLTAQLLRGYGARPVHPA